MISEAYLMDCMEYMKTIPDKYFDLACVDPPYGLSGGLQDISKTFRNNRNRRAENAKYNKGSRLTGSGKLKNRILNKDNCEWDKHIPNQYYFSELFRISKNQIIWGGNYFPLPPTRCVICWDKMQPWENFSQWEMAWTSFDKPCPIFRFDNKAQGKIHPTQKPVALYDWIFKNYLPEGGKVYDSHLGSGSSRIAAHRAGNIDFYATELDPDYFAAQEKRFKQFTAQLTLF